MNDLMSYRIHIGTFCRVAALPSVMKRNKSTIRKLKRRRHPIKDLHLKTFLWLGSVLLLVCVCASSYKNPAGFDGWNNAPLVDIISTNNNTCVNNKGTTVGLFPCLTKTRISISLDLVDLGISRIQSKVLDGISLTGGINLSDISLLPTMTAGTGTCDFLLGNRGSHSYNGNPKREGSPIPGPSW